MQWIVPPLCARCGIPTPVVDATAQAGSLRCAACLREPPRFACARAAIGYDGASRALVLGYKHGDRLHAVPAFARWMAAAGRELLVDADIVAPVPLHWTRLAWRRFNQAALLAQSVARLAERRCVPDLLVRRRRTASQGEYGRLERRRNVRAAFAVPRRHRDRIAAARIVIVDDVLTTGATVEACAEALTAAGAMRVSVLTLARVLRPFDARL
jgi:ComF family protein